jgi:hypothetical protein
MLGLVVAGEVGGGGCESSRVVVDVAVVTGGSVPWVVWRSGLFGAVVAVGFVAESLDCV